MDEADDGIVEIVGVLALFHLTLAPPKYQHKI